MTLPLSARFALLAICAACAGCAKNVSHRLDAVKNDQLQFTSLLSISPIEPPSTFAKSSFVSSSAKFTGSFAQKTALIGPDALKQLGYTNAKNSRQEDGLIIFICHQSEPGRSASIRQSRGMIDITFTISGWSRDRDECPGLMK